MDTTEIKTRIARLGLSQERLARRHLKVDPSLLTRYFRGDRIPPDGFADRLDRILDLLERAERAADEARRKVLEAEAA